MSRNADGTYKNFAKTRKYINKNGMLFLFTLPAVLYLFIFSYLPMGGLVIAFKNYRYDKGIFGSDWVGIDNFRFFFRSSDAWQVTFNTIAYNLAFIVIGTILCISISLLLNEVRMKAAIKFYQTTMFFPNFLSWVVISFMSYALFSNSYGILNRMFISVGLEPIQWYFTPEIWPYILTAFHMWKGVGFGILINYAVLISIDRSYYEAAEIDGASKLKMALYISIPSLVSVTIIQILLSIGRIFHSDFGLFYQIPRNSALLYDKVDVIDTYVFRALTQLNEIGMGAAVGLYQSVVGFVIVLTVNYIVRKIRPEDALL